MTSETENIANFASQIDYKDIPDGVVTEAKKHILDTFGTTLYGSQKATSQPLYEFSQTHHQGDQCTVFGTNTKSSLIGAALSNGYFSHVTDFDDTFLNLPIHPNASVLPAALAVGEAFEKTGKEIIAGYVAGIEVLYKLGMTLIPSTYDRGWHSTGSIGIFGAAVAASSLMDLTEEQTLNALGIAGSFPSGFKGSNFGTHQKAHHPAMAAQVGVRAGLLADSGFTASKAIIEENRGYRDVMMPGEVYDSEPIDDSLGSQVWDFELIRKPEPAGHAMVVNMEILRSVMREENLTSADIQHVEARLPSVEWKTESFLHPPRPEQGALGPKFSFPGSMAIVMQNPEPPNIPHFDSAEKIMEKKETQEAMEKIQAEYTTGEFEYDFLGFGSHVIVTTQDGQEFTRREKYPPDSSTFPLPEERFVTKFRYCAESADVVEVDNLLAALQNFEKVDTMEEITQLL